jgi:hypothetical protein
MPLVASLMLGASIAAPTTGCMSPAPLEEGSDEEIQAGNAPLTLTLAQVNITSLPGASANAGAKGVFKGGGLRFGRTTRPALSNSLLSAVPGAPAKVLFVGQAQPFDQVIVAVQGRSGHFVVPAGGNDLVALDLVAATAGFHGKVTVFVATRANGRLSAPTRLKLVIDERVFVASGDLENHDDDGSNIADVFAGFLEQAQPGVAEQVIESTDNNEDVQDDGVKGVKGPADVGHREVVWDGVPQKFVNRPDFSPDFFDRLDDGDVGVRGGIVFTAVNGSGEEVNDAIDGTIPDLDTPPPADDEDAPLGGDFSNINPRFAGNFLSLTQSAQFAPLGTVITDITFNVAGSTTPAVVHGAGIVFTSVDRGGTSSVEYFDERGRSIIKIFAPPVSQGPFPFTGLVAPDRFPHSFVGFLDLNKRIARVRVISGEAPIDEVADDLPVGKKDVAAFDDVYYSEPLP